MHTMGRNPDGNHWVGRLEVCGGQSALVMMFKGLSFFSALRVVSVLNGGGDVVSLDNTSIRVLEMCQTR